MSRTLPSALIAALLASLLVLAGCGSNGTPTAGSAQSPPPETPAARAAVRSAAAAAKAAEAKAPKGASPTLRQIYRQFPAPKPDPEVKGSAAAIKAGKRACQDKTPTEVKEEFFPAAQPNLAPEQTKMIARVGSFEANAGKDASFVAGQLAADTYQATLPEAVAQAGYQGCIYSLARGLEHRLAPQG